MNDDDYERHLRERERQNYPSTRRFTPEPNVIGMPAERIWHSWCGLKQDLRNKVGGDGGIDVVLTLNILGRPIEVLSDVKGSSFHGSPRKRYLVEAPENLDTEKLYVLAEVWADIRRAHLCGWHWGWRLGQQAPSNELGHGPRHLLPQTELHSMKRLREMFVSARHSTVAEWNAKQRRQ